MQNVSPPGANAPAPHSYPLHEHARIVGGTLTRVHNNWCLYLETGRPEDCECPPAWRLAPAKGGPR